MIGLQTSKRKYMPAINSINTAAPSSTTPTLTTTPPSIKQNSCECSERESTIYYIFRLIITVIAVYLAATCANSDTFSIIIAILFPYLYILFSIYKYNGICAKAKF